MIKTFTALLFALWGFFIIASTLMAGEEKSWSERYVTIGDQIVGILAQSDAEGKAPAILMCHGFGSHKNEVGDMYKRLAEKLARKGIASLRIDFPGWGESGGEMADSSIETRVNAAAEAYEFLSSQAFVDAGRMGILGFSLGGATAIISAGENPDWYKSMVTWSSAGDLGKNFLDSLGQERFDEAMKKGIITIDLGWREVTLKKGFFEKLKEYDILKSMEKYPGAFLSIAGTEDFSATHVPEFASLAKGRPSEGVLLSGADHIFGVLGEDQSTAENVMNRTLKWFQQTL